MVDAGDIESELILNKDAFTRGLRDAQAEAEAFSAKKIEKDVVVHVRYDMSGLSAARAAAEGQAAAAAGGGGGRDGGLLAALGFGAASSGGLPGRRLGMLGLGGLGAGLAGFGTLGSFAGLGLESALTTGVGIAGSALHGAIGGAALGLGTLGVAGVGMGTDLAGIGQAAGDIRQTTTAMDQLNKQIAVYGPLSTQAATAQQQLNFQVSQFPVVAQPAILAAAQQISTFKTMFDQLTGAAEATGAKIIQQAVQVGQTYLPTIGKFAAENMLTIQSSLQPLFQWMQGPGLTIFGELERIFHAHLPAAMDAFNNAIELLIRTLGYLAPYTGRFIDFLDNLFMKLNGPEFGKFTDMIDKSISIFRDWEGLIKAVGRAIYDLFTHDAGTGTAIVVMLTNMVNEFNRWIESARGGAQITAYLQAHKREILDLLQLLPQLVSTFGQLHLIASPYLMDIVGLLARMVHTILDVPFLGNILSIALAFEFLGRHMAPVNALLGIFHGWIKKLAVEALVALGGALTGLGGPFAALGKWLTGLGTEGVTEIGTLTASVDALTASLDAAAASAGGLDVALGAAAAEGEALPAGMAARASGLIVPGAEVGAAGTAAGAATTASVASIAAAAVPAVIATVGIGTLAAGIVGLIQSGRAPYQGPSERSIQFEQRMQQQRPGGGGPLVGPGGLVAPIDLSRPIGAPGFTLQNVERALGQGGLTGAQISRVDPTLAANVSILARNTGLAQQNVEALAHALKIDLNQSLSPAQIQRFTGYVQANGGAARVTGNLWIQAGQQVASALGAMSREAQKQMPNVSGAVRNMITATQPHLVALVGQLNRTGQQAAGQFITQFVARIPQAELASSQMHDKIHSPLIPLVNELNALGETSAARMVQQFINQQPKAKSAAQGMHDNLANPLYSLETQLAASGNIAAAQFIQQFIKRHPEAATASGLLHDAITNKLTPLETELEATGNLAAANLVRGISDPKHTADLASVGGQWADALAHGFANGVQANTSVVTGSVTQLTAAAKTAGFHSMGAHSPSMVFHELGKNVAEGFANGITAYAHLPVQATANMMMNVNRAGAFTAGGNASNTFTGPAVHIDNVNIQDRTDMQTFMNMADFHLQMRRAG